MTRRPVIRSVPAKIEIYKPALELQTLQEMIEEFLLVTSEQKRCTRQLERKIYLNAQP
jgi:hypothetical protein